MASLVSRRPVLGARAGRARNVSVVCGKSLFGGPWSAKPSVPYSKYGGTGLPSALMTAPAGGTQKVFGTGPAIDFKGVHHVALLCENVETSLAFYQGILGLQINPDRPHHKLPYRGAWLMIGPEMIHLMELPNPDPLSGRPEHGGRDRHFCVGVAAIDPLVSKLQEAGVPYTKSMSGRPALFFRDPDMNCLECVEMESWRG